ncbi:MAG: hypothetical protein M5R40_08795 [Anaerolineae bacterium]|nr:hypothetical protein [Anaerolineae bacterium]
MGWGVGGGKSVPPGGGAGGGAGAPGAGGWPGRWPIRLTMALEPGPPSWPRGRSVPVQAGNRHLLGVKELIADLMQPGLQLDIDAERNRPLADPVIPDANAVDVEAGAVVALDTEAIPAGLREVDGRRPARGEEVVVDARVRRAGAPVIADDRVGARDNRRATQLRVVPELGLPRDAGLRLGPSR